MVFMSRTNIDIDDDLIERVMRLYALETKRSAVHFALERLVDRPMSKEEMLSMRGTGWDGDLVEMRTNPHQGKW